MPRQCSENAVNQIGNRYDLILVSSQRVRELSKGHQPKLQTNNHYGVIALTEIENGLVGREYLAKLKQDKKHDEYDRY